MTNDGFAVKVYSKVKVILLTTLKEIVNAACTEAMFLRGNLDEIPKKIQGIALHLNKVRRALSRLVQHIENGDRKEIEHNFEAAKLEITKYMGKFLDGIKAVVSLQNFDGVEKRLRIAEQVSYLLGSHCDKTIDVRIKNLRESAEKS